VVRDRVLSGPAVRRAGAEDAVALMRALRRAFGGETSAEAERLAPALFGVGRAWVAEERGAVVATAQDYDTELAVPGGSLPAAALTAVSVLPTHRRRGLLRELMRRHLEGARERGTPLAVLLASEHPIYGRFGYGPATEMLDAEVDPRAVRLPDEPDPGRVRLVDADEAAALLPGIHEAARLAGVGDIRRAPQWWELHRADLEERRGGASARFVALHEDAGGRPDGYAAYRMRPEWRQWVPNGELVLDEVIAGEDATARALWRYLAGVDLVTRIAVGCLSLDDPLRWALEDPRAVRIVERTDWLWVRVVDPGGALAGRRYAQPGRIALDVADPFLPEAGGVWVVEAGPEGAECRRGEGPADVALDVRELGSVYLGGVTLRALARAGLVRELTPGAVARADAMLAAEREPFCATHF
jgi:predicted acetyltransferase